MDGIERFFIPERQFFLDLTGLDPVGSPQPDKPWSYRGLDNESVSYSNCVFVQNSATKQARITINKKLVDGAIDWDKTPYKRKVKKQGVRSK